MNEQVTISGHSAQVEQTAGYEKIYTFEDKTSKNEKLQVGLLKGYNPIFAIAWHKKGYTKEQLKSWWLVTVWTNDTHKNYAYNPTIKGDTDKSPTNFEWIIEATEENAKRLLEEVVKRAYGSDATQPEKVGGSDAAERLTFNYRGYTFVPLKGVDEGRYDYVKPQSTLINVREGNYSIKEFFDCLDRQLGIKACEVYYYQCQDNGKIYFPWYTGLYEMTKVN